MHLKCEKTTFPRSMRYLGVLNWDCISFGPQECIWVSAETQERNSHVQEELAACLH